MVNCQFAYQAARCAVPLDDVRAVQAVLNELLRSNATLGIGFYLSTA
jgi:hypothetical protein